MPSRRSSACVMRRRRRFWSRTGAWCGAPRISASRPQRSTMPSGPNRDSHRIFFSDNELSDVPRQGSNLLSAPVTNVVQRRTRQPLAVLHHLTQKRFGVSRWLSAVECQHVLDRESIAHHALYLLAPRVSALPGAFFEHRHGASTAFDFSQLVNA